MLMYGPIVDCFVIYFNCMKALILIKWLFVPGVFIDFELQKYSFCGLKAMLLHCNMP